MNKWENSGRISTQNYTNNMNDTRFYKKNLGGIIYPERESYYEDTDSIGNKNFNVNNYNKMNNIVGNSNNSKTDWKNEKNGNFTRTNNKYKTFNDFSMVNQSSNSEIISNGSHFNKYKEMNAKNNNFTEGNISQQIKNEKVFYNNKINRESNFELQSQDKNIVNYKAQGSLKKENNNLVIQNNNKIFLENVSAKTLYNTHNTPNSNYGRGNYYNNVENVPYSSNNSHYNNSVKNNNYFLKPPMQPWGLGMVNSENNYPIVQNSSHSKNNYYFDSQLNPVNNRPTNEYNQKYPHEKMNRNKINSEKNVIKNKMQIESKNLQSILKVNIKLKDQDRIIYLKRGEDYMKKAAEFCFFNKIKDSLIKPIYDTILRASESIEKVMLQEITNSDKKQLDHIKDKFESFTNENKELNFSCITILDDCNNLFPAEEDYYNQALSLSF